MASEKQIKYQNRWNAKNLKHYSVTVNRNDESAIIDYLDSYKQSKNAYIKSLIKADMQKNHFKRVYMLDLTGSTNARLIKHLDSQENVSKYLENLVLNDMTK